MTRMHPTPTAPATRAIALVALLSLAASADPIQTLPGLGAHNKAAGNGLFSHWGAEPHRLLAALRSLHLESRSKSIEAREQQVRQTPKDAGVRELLARAYAGQKRVGEALAQYRAALALDPQLVSARLGMVDLYIGAGRRELAARELARLVKQKPDGREIRLRLAGLYVGFGDYRKASEQLAVVVRQRPGDVAARLRLAATLLRSRQAAEAKGEIDALVKLAPDDVAPRLLLAAWHRSQGEWGAARRVLESAAEAQPKSAAPISLGLVLLHEQEWDAAKAVFAGLASARKPSALALEGGIVAAQGRGDWDGAADLCRRLRETKGQLGGVLLANAWLAKGDASAVRAACSALPGARSELGPGYDELLAATAGRPDARREVALQFGLGLVFRHAGWIDEAIEALGRAEKLAPGCVLVGDLLAACYGLAGRHGEALALLEKMAGNKPRNKGIAMRLAQVRLQRADTAGAKLACERLLTQRPGDIDALVFLSKLATSEGDYTRGVETARGAMRNDPTSREALRAALVAFLATGNLDDAAAAVRAYVAANPQSEVSTLANAVVAAAGNRLERALELCRVGIERKDVHAALRLVAAHILERRGDLKGAVGQLQGGALANPRFVPIQQALGRTALCAGLPAVAVNAFRKVTLVAPGLVDAQVGLAHALSRAGRQEQAIRYLLALRPKDPAAQRTVQAHLASEYARRGDSARALAVAEEVLMVAPDHAIARKVAVDAYRRRDDLAAAVKVYERILARQPAADVVGNLGILRILQLRYKDAARLLGTAVEKAEAGKAGELLFWRAAAWMALGKRKDGAGAARRAMAEWSEKELSSVGGALVLSVGGVEPMAGKALGGIKATNSDMAQWVSAAAVRLQADNEALGRVVGALAAARYGWQRTTIRLLASALDRAPGEPLLLYLLAVRQRSLGLHGKALGTARALCQAAPKSGSAQFLLGRLLEARKNTQGAVEAYRRAAAVLTDHNETVWVQMAQCFAAAGEVDDAIAAYKAVLAFAPDHAAVCNNLAWLYANEKPGMLVQAEKLGAKAVAKEPRVAAFRDTLGWIYFIHKKYDAARREAEEAVRLSPDKANYLYHLGMIHFVQGRHDHARRMLRKALTLDPALDAAGTIRSTLKAIAAKKPPAKPPQPTPAPKPTP